MACYGPDGGKEHDHEAPKLVAARDRGETLRPVLKSSKITNVCYDIRGPVLARARQT